MTDEGLFLRIPLNKCLLSTSDAQLVHNLSGMSPSNRGDLHYPDSTAASLSVGCVKLLLCWGSVAANVLFCLLIAD